MVARSSVFALLCCSWLVIPAQAQVVVYANDFDGSPMLSPGVSGGLSGAGSSTPAAGYSGLGTIGNQFSGSFLRNATPDGPPHGSPGQINSPSRLVLSSLPAHTHVDLDFLLGIIDSWDGGALPPFGPDRFVVQVDGATIFSEAMSEVNNASRPQTYVAPPGGQLAFNTQLGFSTGGGFNDAAYDMSLESKFFIPHNASSITIDWFADGSGWQGGDDESWAIDNLKVTVVPEPTMTATCLVLSTLLYRRTASR